VEAAQIVLVVVVVVLTVLLGAVGVQVFLVLREVRWSLRRVNRILDETEVMVRSVTRPAVVIGEGLAQAAGILRVIGRFLGGRKDV
jgi:hypothetical protein